MKKARKLTRTSFRAFSISGCNLFRVILGLYYNQISQKISKNFYSAVTEHTVNQNIQLVWNFCQTNAFLILTSVNI